jgi:very-short-patch-repair endonuclease
MPEPAPGRLLQRKLDRSQSSSARLTHLFGERRTVHRQGYNVLVFTEAATIWSRMLHQDNISVSQALDVVAFVYEQVGHGSAIGAVYPRIPAAAEAIDDLSLALARHVLNRGIVNTSLAPRDRWLQSAYALVEADKPPLPEGFSAETNVNCLLRWADSKCERVLIGVVPELDFVGLRDVRAVAEWMWNASSLPVTVVHGSPVQAQTKPPSFKSSLEATLAKELDRDEELRGLFEPNVRILTVFQTRPCVDLVWRAGRLIVEIDSYRFHSSKQHFADDRQRDYETFVTGYVTLRLTDREVSTDLRLAVQKIRRIVYLRKRLLHV